MKDLFISVRTFLYSKFPLLEQVISLILVFLTFLWEKVGAYIANFVLVGLLEFFSHANGFVAIMYVIFNTIGKKAIAAFFILFIFDIFREINEILIWDPNEMVSLEEYELARFFPPIDHPDYKISYTERGLGFLAILWPLTQIFMYHLEIVRGYEFLSYIEHEYLRGLIFFLAFTPFNNAIITLYVFRELVRRRGPDTVWSGQYHKFWIKHFVRYMWGYASCLNTLIQLFMFVYLKFFIADGMDSYQQENVSTVFVGVGVALCFYGGLGPILGFQPRFPLFHGACRFHAGRLKCFSEYKKKPF